MTGALLVLVVAVLPPIAQVAGELIRGSNALGLLAAARVWWLLIRSLLLSAAVTASCIVIGVPLGVSFARADFPLRKVLIAAHLCVGFLPPFLPALGWFHIFGREGLLGNGATARALFSELGVVLVLSSCFAPIVSALTALGISGVDESLEEAGRVSIGRVRTAALVLVPCAAPAISLAALIVFALTFSELGVPMFLSVDVYPTVVFARLGGMDFAPGEAAVFMLPLLLVAFVLAVLERRFAGRQALAAMGAMRRSRRPLFESQAWWSIPPVLAALVSLAPLAALANAADVHGSPELLDWLDSTPYSSLLSSGAAAAIMTVVALVLGSELAKNSRAGAYSDALSTLAFLMPSSILGVGLIAAWNREGTDWLYGTSAIVVVGFVARYSAVAIRTYAAVLTQVPASLDAAARVAGVSYLGRLQLMLRTTPRGITGTFMLSMIFALRDLETAVLYYPPGGQPLTVRIFTLEANGPPGVVSALALIHVALTLMTLGFGALLLRRTKL